MIQLFYRTALFTTLVIFSLSAVSALNAETYRWADDSGGLHFSDSLDKVPSDYRQRATTEMESSTVNVMPGSPAPERSITEPPGAAENAKAGSRRKPVAKKMKKSRHAGSGIKKKREVLNNTDMQTLPARRTQSEAEERIRSDRQTLDAAQLPARRAQDQAEEQIRKAREGTIGPQGVGRPER